MINDINVGTRLIEILIANSPDSQQGRIKVLLYYLDELLDRLEKDVELTSLIVKAANDFYESLEDALNTHGQLEHVEQLIDKLTEFSLVLGKRRPVAKAIFDALQDWWGTCLTVAQLEQVDEIVTLLENYLEQAVKDTDENRIYLNQLIRGYEGIRKNVTVGFKRIPVHYWSDTLIVKDIVSITSVWKVDATDAFLALSAERAKIVELAGIKK